MDLNYSPEETAIIHSQIQAYREYLEDELGPFKVETLPTGRVLILPENELPHVAYMFEDRLVFDDYVPELGDPNLNKKYPSDQQQGG